MYIPPFLLGFIAGALVGVIGISLFAVWYGGKDK